MDTKYCVDWLGTRDLRHSHALLLPAPWTAHST